MSDYRYTFEKYKGPASRHTCPSCRKGKVFTRYIDRQTGLHLPEQYGRCNRENNCGHHLNPYKDGYAKARKESLPLLDGGPLEQEERKVIPFPKEVFERSFYAYEDNTFFQLLEKHFGHEKAFALTERFLLGSSNYWPGACVFWIVNDVQQAVGGQVVVFDERGNTLKEKNEKGQWVRRTSWVHTALKARYRKQKKTLPRWLNEYCQKAEKFPFPFGFHQLRKAPLEKPIAIVEAPKTAIIASGHFPEFTWMAIGSLSYLTPKRLSALKGRNLTLFPDQGAYDRWNEQAVRLRNFAHITVSRLLEQKGAPGSDLADYLLRQQLSEA